MKKCWDILIKQLFEVKNNARKLFAKSYFFELKLKERSKVSDFMRIIKKILNEPVEQVEFENIPSNNMVVEQVINALPRSYDISIHVISNENDMSTLKDLFKWMQLKENRNQNRVHSNDKETLIINFWHHMCACKFYNNYGNNNQDKKGKCNRWDRKGHWPLASTQLFPMS